MNTIIDNWQLIVAGICAIACIIESTILFALEPNDTKIKNLKEWLMWAVVEAEKYFGSGMGSMKLRYVYDLAIKQFPWLIKLVSFDTFSKWVDEALVWMRNQLNTNANIKNYIEDKDA